jgi:hypothetical protein
VAWADGIATDAATPMHASSADAAILPRAIGLLMAPPRSTNTAVPPFLTAG